MVSWVHSGNKAGVDPATAELWGTPAKSPDDSRSHTYSKGSTAVATLGTADSGASTPSLGGCLCVNKQQVWFPWGGYGSQDPALPPLLVPAPAPSTAPPRQDVGQDPAGSLLRSPLTHAGQARDRSGCHAVCEPLILTVAPGRCSLVPTLQMGTLRFSGCCDLASSQDSKAAARRPRPTYRCPHLHSGASPHRPPQQLNSVSLETLIQKPVGRIWRWGGVWPPGSPP